MDFRIIPLKKRKPNTYDPEETYVIPVTIIKIMEDMKKGPVVPIIIERLDFFSAEKVKTLAITFNKSLDIFKEFEKVLPFNTDCIVFKENGKISFKVIGIYNTGLIEELYSLEDHILNNDEEQIIQLYESNYKDIRSWVGNINSNMYDVKNI